ncbi:MAG: N,N-diacetylchitobiose transport system substrate-binding protein [Gaiellaceae bacterium]|jgi:N,N'-diacetylchitobiose transport system substrate-binding protein|nr:N,N-diacetylchitobiose transport system substrate-binding protein [Gaiellaceae bacterium]
MRLRVVALAAVAVLLGLVAATASASPQRAQANKLTVWLQVDAQSGWPDVVAAATQQFQKDHAGWTVDVQYQNWGDHLQKFDATLAGGNTPDVIEMGNTEMTKYMAAGAFADISSFKSSFANSASWLKGLAASGTYGGHLYGVPYYAGSRVVTYRTDAWSALKLKAPTSLAQFTSDIHKLATKNSKTKGFSPVYVAGTDWYFAMSFVYDYGGSIAKTKGGKWQGTLDSPQAVAGLTAFKKFFLAASKAPATSDENHPAPYDVYSQGTAASIIGPGWFSCCVGTKYKTTTAQFVMPSHTAGKPMPGFLGGSDLAVPAPSKNAALAADWIKDFTSTDAQKSLQAKGNIPNATNLLGTSVNERAAARSWFVPAAKHWVDVENGNILRNMLAQILRGKLTVKQAAASASDNITSVLNGS